MFLLDPTTGAAIDRITMPGVRARELAVHDDHLWVMADGLRVWSTTSGTELWTADSPTGTGLAAHDGDLPRTWTIHVHELDAPSPHPTEESMEVELQTGEPTAFAAIGTHLYFAGEGRGVGGTDVFVVSFD